MRQNFILYAFLLIICSCSRPGKGLFGKKQSPHEKYTDSIIKEGYDKTKSGNTWLTASETSLLKPFQLQLPYSEAGYFNAERPAAAGFEFEAKRGMKIHANTARGLFLDLFELATGKPVLLASAARMDSVLHYVVTKDGRYILRVQPEIEKNMFYQLQLYTGPSLSFPVQRTGNPKIISLWGVGRDNGTRSHEGVDIGAVFHTPALAAADGRITSVSENKLGGKVVFILPDDADFNLYYAHLDTQFVRQGQRVNAGDIIGLVGNSGNAQYTVPHLHFGIYTNAGAIDPLVFIDNRQAKPVDLKVSTTQLNTWVQSQASNILHNGPSIKNIQSLTFSAGDSLLVTALTDEWIRVWAPAGQSGYVKRTKIKKQAKKK